MKIKFTGLLSPWTQKVKLEDITTDKIQALTVRQRMFTLIDTDRPFCLDVQVKHTHFSHLQFMPPYMYIPKFKDTYTSSFRYKTLEECNNEFERVKSILKLHQD